MSNTLSQREILEASIKIASCYISNNKVDIDEIPTVMAKAYTSLNDLYSEKQSLVARPAPFVPISESVTDDYIICLEDGKKLQMLKRHLKAVYSMSLEEYKERWNLPVDYPTVAPSYARRRTQIAKNIGLGTARSKKAKRAA